MHGENMKLIEIRVF